MDCAKLYSPLPEPIATLLCSVIGGVEQIMSDKEFKQLMPTVHTINDKKVSVYGIAIDFDESTKPLVGSLIRKLTAENDAAIFVTEAWTTRQSSRRSPALCAALNSGRDAVVIAPRLDPERAEEVVIRLHIKERLVMVNSPITRIDGRATLGKWAVQMDSADPAVKIHPMNFG